MQSVSSAVERIKQRRCYLLGVLLLLLRLLVLVLVLWQLLQFLLWFFCARISALGMHQSTEEETGVRQELHEFLGFFGIPLSFWIGEEATRKSFLEFRKF